MKDFVVFINTYKGTDYVLKIIERVAKAKGMLDIYREMMEHITKIHNIRPWGEIQKFAQKIGCYLYDGDKPSNDSRIKIQGIFAKGKVMMNILKNRYDVKLELDENSLYHLDEESGALFEVN